MQTKLGYTLREFREPSDMYSFFSRLSKPSIPRRVATTLLALVCIGVSTSVSYTHLTLPTTPYV